MSLKKKVTQGDLRKAMTEAKKKVGSVKKIESPLAKYPFYTIFIGYINSLSILFCVVILPIIEVGYLLPVMPFRYTDAGQLMCILCKSIVRSETVWPVHLNSKSHKENLLLAKKSINEKEKQKENASISKRPSSPPDKSGSHKKFKGILKNAGHPKAPSNLPADFFDSAKNINLTTTSKVSEKSEIPRAEQAREGGSKVANEAMDEANPASLPEGFFDDPRMDAKVRNVDYKDPIEEEWDKFQKEIKEETAQSAQIIADDQEEATTERQIDEIDEQIRQWSRVMHLVKRKEEVQKDSDKQKDSASNGISSDEDEEYDEFLDWRAKNSYH